ncbi:uncharacterized protein YpeP-like [Oryza brachyantha]|uniref:uncharacterized protein YpeP-like n=1 Tax=Oryza brachyantha TaxID=4533 RepID=UPI00077654DE|nr:uncharacterized protein YpeP-like [Oryza brachyantha]
MGKCILALTEYDLKYESPKAVKGQVMADFIVEHHKEADYIEVAPWTVFFDGLVCRHGCGMSLMIISPRGACFEFAYTIKPYRTNNQAEYEALIKGLELLKEIGVEAIEIMGDSHLVIKQLSGEYKCREDVLKTYHEAAKELLEDFEQITLTDIPREQNTEANSLAQGASGYR